MLGGHTTAMTEQEARAWTGRLTRIWQIKPPIEAPTWNWGDDYFYFFLCVAKGICLYFWICGEDITVELKDMDRSELSYRDGQIQKACTYPNADEPKEQEDELGQFAVEWMPFFVSGCWLSGCAIEATTEEKEKWMEGFYQGELEEWGLKDADEEVKWEAAQVAVAFESVLWEQWRYRGGYWRFTSSNTGDGHLECRIMSGGGLMDIKCGSIAWCRMDFYYCEFTPVDSAHSNSADLHHIMARGLYRLGVTNEEIICQLPPLSAREKLGLRLSMPREFWPQKWIDEEQ